MAATVIGAGTRTFLVVAVPALVAGAVNHRVPRSAAAVVGVLFGVLVLGAGVIADRGSLLVAGLLYLLAGLSRAWGVNRGRRRRRAWANRILTLVGTLLVGFVVVYPTLIAVDYLAKRRAAIDQTALGLPHEQVVFPASDPARVLSLFDRALSAR